MQITGRISPVVQINGAINIVPSEFRTQEKTVVPTNAQQIVVADSGYNALSKVTVSAIPNNYGLITYNGFEITVS